MSEHASKMMRLATRNVEEDSRAPPVALAMSHGSQNSTGMQLPKRRATGPVPPVSHGAKSSAPHDSQCPDQSLVEGSTEVSSNRKFTQGLVKSKLSVDALCDVAGTGTVRIMCLGCGSALDKLCCENLVDATKEIMQDRNLVSTLRFVYVAVAERDPDIRCNLIRQHKRDLGFVLSDIAHCCQDQAWDYAGEEWVQPSALTVDMIISGLSCTDISGLNNTPKAFTDCAGATGGTYIDELAAIAHFRPKIVLRENVKSFSHCTKKNPVSPLEIQNRDMAGLGYKFYGAVLDAHEYGSPQSRKRWYMVFFFAGHYKLWLGRSLFATISSFACSPPSLAEFLGASPGPLLAHVRPCKLRPGPAWQRHVSELLEKFEVSPEDHAHKTVEVRQTLPRPREASTVALALLLYGDRALDAFIPVQMSPKRVIAAMASKSSYQKCPCVTPGALLYIPRLKKMLSSEAHAALQGLGRHEAQRLLPRVSGHADTIGSFEKRLIGNAFHANVFSAVLLAVVLHFQR